VSLNSTYALASVPAKLKSLKIMLNNISTKEAKTFYFLDV